MPLAMTIRLAAVGLLTSAAAATVGAAAVSLAPLLPAKEGALQLVADRPDRIGLRA